MLAQKRLFSIRQLIHSSLAVFLIGAWLLSMPGVAFAQDELPEDAQVTVSQLDVSQYPEITIYVSVTDEDGDPLPMLDQENFTLTEDGQPVDIVEFAGIGEQRPVDVVFVFDTTGSMDDEISAMIDTSIEFAQELDDRGRDYRLGLVAFGDEIRGIYNSDRTLTPDAAEFQDWMRTLEAIGGNEDPENDYGAIKQAAHMQFRSAAQTIFILITDAPVHHYGDLPDEGFPFDDPDLDLDPILGILSERAVTVYVVGPPGVPELVTLAEQTSGTYYDISANPDFTSMIEDIGATIANQYRVTYRSPRPTYDGTRRDVRVSIGEAEAAVEYTETHLLNIQSDLWIGAICILPMLAALGIPPLVQLVSRTLRPTASHLPLTTNFPQSAAVSGSSEYSPGLPEPVPPQPLASPPVPGVQNICPHCGHHLRPEAQFCPRCGNPLGPPTSRHLSGKPIRKATPTVVDLQLPSDSLPGGVPATSAKPGSVPTQYSPASSAAVQTTDCPHCGRQLRPGARFCPACGKPPA